MTYAPLPKAAPRARPSIPGPGSSLVAATEVRAVHVRRAVESVRRSFASRESMVGAGWANVLASRWRAEPLPSSDLLSWQAAWALVTMRVIGRSLGFLRAGASLSDGEAWFLGQVRPPALLSHAVVEFADHEAVGALESFPYDDDFRDLLPYVLDAHGPGSRASVMKDPGTRQARQAKRAAGVFYTPSDVAEYIAREALGDMDHEAECPRVLDPACGSGVFLKATLDLTRSRRPELNRFDFAERSLYGIDVNPLAIEAACFVLLHECLGAGQGGRDGPSPWSRWHRLRCNLCTADALAFEITSSHRDDSDVLARLRARLDDGYVPPSDEGPASEAATTLFPSDRRALGRVFPALSLGADIVIGNPPYARIGPRGDATALAQRFASLSSGNTVRSDCFPLFIEMMWRLARPGRSSSGMVVPLSLACSRRPQMVAVRKAIRASGGRWRFAFFDREPHALFGEEVKTRNTIALRCDRSDVAAGAAIEIGPLRRWTSRQRTQLFDTIEFTPIENEGLPIGSGIPKLAGEESARVFGRLARRTARLRDMCSSIGSCLPEEVSFRRGRASVFVAGTAYNFLNVFRPHRELPPQRAPWSSSKVVALGFADEDEAARGFALLSSRISYWLWRVSEDGFHVTRSFLTELPFNDRIFNEADRTALTGLGSRLWGEIQTRQIVSINGDRQTVAYRPDASEGVRDEIDALLLEALDVSPSFLEYLQEFTRAVANVGRRDETRPSLALLPDDGEQRCHA